MNNFEELSSVETMDVNGGGIVNDLVGSIVGGASTGAAIGTATVPGPGTAGGIVIGGMAGLLVGSVAVAVDIYQSKKR